ncbi:hypothetical protein COY87_05425 [Candidatus Roizmanbacteria bacterium CG_4_10_14_0_8_um_filter_33_9]|uniref:DUF2207 domain-containing protein n=1 Tax=Candidatus Roizmanbacteria bacterium CG_4_10_14_0_8_um_filter_33_9 TaxID=1974826 RepID=A0A2M7QGX7_9BACT|nr:MAG: hypothetical protein COY87_05425 [Candidatus Roizmanbacteria bacterium CG_4_10_14_0_8_um_filter_33_9]
MKRYFIFFFLLVSFFLFSQNVIAEEISNFDSKIVILSSGQIQIEERIVYDFGGLYKHGIFRSIPYIKTNTDGKQFRMEINVQSVVDELGKPFPYTVSSLNNNISVRIGDPNNTITGLHTYIITYSVKGAITYFSDHDELYWNITGNEWTVPIQYASLQISFPKQFDVSEIKTSCFTGLRGSTIQNCLSLYNSGIVEGNTKIMLSGGEGLTEVVSFPKGAVAVLEPKEVVSFFSTFLGKLFVLLVSIVALFWYIILPILIPIKWLLYGKDPRVGAPVRAWYDPPKTKDNRFLTPSETGVLIDEKVDARDMFAAVIDLARRGYLLIEERKKREFYFIKQKKSDKETLQLFEQELLDGIFEDGPELKLKDADLVDTMSEIKKTLYKSMVTNGYFDKNPETTRTFYIAIGIFGLMTGNLMLFVVALVFGRIMPRKTRLGAEQANVAKSLRNFLTSQERQLAFQAEKQMFFEKLLPFAIAFGVEKVWAKRFKDMNLSNPSWYKGYDNSTFNSVFFMSSMSSSFSHFQGAMTPTSSSSGFSSGFSGGSSGGGGGGGGGGSW